MITRKEIVDNVLLAVRRQKDAEYRKAVESFLQKHVYSVSEMHSFHKLRQVMEIDTAEADGFPHQGVWIPSNLAGIDAVRDQHGRDLVRRDEAHIDPDERIERFFSYVPQQSPLFVGDDLFADQGIGHFTSSHLSSYLSSNPDVDIVGEYVRFSGKYGNFKITEQNVEQFHIEPVYHGEALAENMFEVRPTGTQKLVIIKPNGDQVVGGKYKLHYWTYHPALSLDSDPILFPHAPLIEYIVLREALNNLGRRQLSSDKHIRDIDEAWRVTRRLNPSFPRQTGPRGRNNRAFKMNQNLYRKR